MQNIIFVLNADKHFAKLSEISTATGVSLMTVNAINDGTTKNIQIKNLVKIYDCFQNKMVTKTQKRKSLIMKINVELPNDFNDNMQTSILNMARESFQVVMNESQYPQYMRIKQAAQFMNCSRSTLTGTFIPAGLKVIIIEKIMFIDKRDAIEFMMKHKSYKIKA